MKYKRAQIRTMKMKHFQARICSRKSQIHMSEILRISEHLVSRNKDVKK